MRTYPIINAARRVASSLIDSPSHYESNAAYAVVEALEHYYATGEHDDLMAVAVATALAATYLIHL